MQAIVHIAIVVRDYDEAIEFYVTKLGFELLDDTFQPEQNKRWVVVAPPGGSGTTLLLAKASKPEQEAFIGNQAGGRVFLFLNSDDFWRDYERMRAKGVTFVREPKEEAYGTVAVFEDLYGNLWDLLQLNASHPIAAQMRPATRQSLVTWQLPRVESNCLLSIRIARWLFLRGNSSTRKSRT